MTQALRFFGVLKRTRGGEKVLTRVIVGSQRVPASVLREVRGLIRGFRATPPNYYKFSFKTVSGNAIPKNCSTCISFVTHDLNMLEWLPDLWQAAIKNGGGDHRVLTTLFKGL